MTQEMNEFSALRTHIKHLKHAVATTTCRKTVGALQQMLKETEAKLRAIEPRPPAEGMTDPTICPIHRASGGPHKTFISAPV